MSLLLDGLLRKMRTLGATDLFLTHNKPATLRLNGRLVGCSDEPLQGRQLEEILRHILPPDDYAIYLDDKEANLGYSANGLGRFRVSLFQQRHFPAIVIRAIPDHIPTLEELGVPPILRDVVMLRRGLILIGGPAGSGKSTSLAALLTYRAQHAASHIISLEEPIEYLLEHHQSIVNQREIGVDARDYAAALGNVLRQSPDVLAIGEIRNRETMEAALRFADSGHLCLATLHANNVTQTIERAIAFFPENMRHHAVQRLAPALRAVLAQQLVSDSEGRLVAAWELLLGSPRVADQIRRGEFKQLIEGMEKGGSGGMQSMDQSLYNLYLQGRISAETALEYASSYRDMRLRMRLAGARQQLQQS